MHICVSNIFTIIIGPDNSWSPGRRQAIIRTNVGILLIRTLRTNFNEILIAIITFSFKKISLKVSSEKRLPFCLGLNVLNGSSFFSTQCVTKVNHHGIKTIGGQTYTQTLPNIDCISQQNTFLFSINIWQNLIFRCWYAFESKII